MTDDYEWHTRRIPNGANLYWFDLRRNILHTITLRPSRRSTPFQRAGKRLQQMSMSRRDMAERWTKNTFEREHLDKAIARLNEDGILVGEMNDFPLVNLDRPITGIDYR